MSLSSRRQTRRRRRARRKVEEVQEGVRGFGRGAVWSALFLALLSSLSGMAVMVVAGAPLYSALFLPSALLSGVALWVREGG